MDFYKEKAVELTSLFNMQAMKLLEQYTHVRQEVIRQNHLVHQAAKYANFQEKIITELRQFIHLNLAPTLEILDQMNED